VSLHQGRNVMNFDWLAALLAVASAVIASAPPNEMTSLGPVQDCTAASIDDLWANPGAYRGRRVCVSGFLGRMVPYGEDRPDLYATPEEAQTRHAERYVTIGVPMTIASQEALSRRAVQPVRVEGVFEFDPRCWPPPGQSQAEYTCFPARPMRIANAELTFAMR
jgi:hypothetical protein